MFKSGLWGLIVFILLGGQPLFAAKCMLVMSYHPGYSWNDDVQEGVEKVLANKCELQVFYMDTKRHKEPEHARTMAAKAKQFIDQFQPDVLIAADDHASRYLVMEYYKNADLPVVFCAVNWDVSEYGYPYKNVTGMIEVAPIQPLIEVARKLSPELRTLVYLGANTLTEEKNARRVAQVLKRQGIVVEVVLVDTVLEWQRAFVKAQTADVVMLGSNAGIDGWRDEELVDFVPAHIARLVVTNHDWMAPFAVYAMTKIPQEQGAWAAEAALGIINGLPANKIPMRVNRKWQTYINRPLLGKIALDHTGDYFNNAIDVGGHIRQKQQ